MKICRECKKELPIGSFYERPSMKDGYVNSCKDCHSKKSRKYRLDNIEKIRAYDRKRSRLEHRKEQSVKYKKAAASRRIIISDVTAWRKKNPEKHKAQNAVAIAIRAGKIKKRPCEKCGTIDNIHAHHEDYSKPLDIMWLCSKHHGERHIELNELSRQNK